MSRKSIAKKPGCALCGAKEVSEPRGEERYCRDCWDKKIAVEEIVASEFALKRYIREHSAEKYLIYHSTQKRPCGQLIVVDDGYDLFLTMVIYPNFGWDEPAYHLEGDPEGRTFAELLVDVVATEVIEPWGGGKWNLEAFRATAAEAEDWNGEMEQRPDHGWAGCIIHSSGGKFHETPNFDDGGDCSWCRPVGRLTGRWSGCTTQADCPRAG